MLAQKDFNDMWQHIHDSMSVVEHFEENDWDDDLGIITISYDVYEYDGIVSIYDTDVWFKIKAKTNNGGKTFYSIEIIDWYIQQGADDIFDGYDDPDQCGNFTKMEEAFDKAANKIH